MLCSTCVRLLGGVRLNIPLVSSRIFYSDDKDKNNIKTQWKSVLDDSNVQSPFANPQRQPSSSVNFMLIQWEL